MLNEPGALVEHITEPLEPFRAGAKPYPDIVVGVCRFTHVPPRVPLREPSKEEYNDTLSSASVFPRLYSQPFLNDVAFPQALIDHCQPIEQSLQRYLSSRYRLFLQLLHQ